VGKGALTRQAILERAVGLASQVGLEGLSVGRLAEDLGLSKSGLFAHFQSKQALQVQTLELAAQRFVELVVSPALRAARGEPRVRALFERWLEWPQAFAQPGGCVFVAAAAELDDQPGPARELLVKLQKDWLEGLATAARSGVREGHFRRDLDVEQFAFEEYGLMLVTHQAWRLLADKQAFKRARRGFDSLIERARVQPA